MVRICSVIGCSNSTAKLEKWYSQLCEIHGLYFGSCICKPPFQLFPYPTETRDPEARRRWIKLINRKTKDGRDWQPNYQDRVCSVHFLESEPTPSLPDPTEFLGYDTLEPGTYSKRKLPRDPPEESLPFREIVPEISIPKKKRKQDALSKVNKQRQNKKEGSPVAVEAGMPEKKEEQTVTENEPLSMVEQPTDHCYSHLKSNQSDCEGPDNVTIIKQLEEKVGKLKHQLKVAKNHLKVAKLVQNDNSMLSVGEAVFSVPKTDQKRKQSSRALKRAENESLSSSLGPGVGDKRYRSTRKVKKALKCC